MHKMNSGMCKNDADNAEDITILMKTRGDVNQINLERSYTRHQL